MFFGFRINRKSHGLVSPSIARRHDEYRDDRSERDQRILGDPGNFTLGEEPGNELFAIK
jgi:hypothetical protein